MNTIKEQLEQNYMTLTEVARDTKISYNSLYKFLKGLHLIQKVGTSIVINRSLIDLVLQYKSFRTRGERFNHLLFRIEEPAAFERVIEEITR